MTAILMPFIWTLVSRASDFIQLEAVGNQLGQRQADSVGALEEVKRGWVILRGIHPGAYGGYFLVAEVEMMVDDAFPAVHEEAHLAQAAAALHELPGVGPGLADARALEHEIRQTAAVVRLHGVQQGVQVGVCLLYTSPSPRDRG